jgi:hypothetical protein
VTHFQFITFQSPNDQNDKITKRVARSHAVKQVLQNKRNLRQASMDNFYIHTIKGGKNAEETIGKAFPEISSALSPATLSAGIMDPFDSLAIKGTRLQHLLNICRFITASTHRI